VDADVVMVGAEVLGLSTALGCALAGLSALSPGRSGPMPDDALVSRGLWQCAHYYDRVTGGLADTGVPRA
jgi:hypothetical protein